MKTHSGFSLIELIIFIVVVGILITGIFVTFNEINTRVTTPEGYTIATQLAQERLEMIVGQRRHVGFASFADPCAGGPPPVMCNLPAGYNIAQPTITVDPDPNFKTITVAVTGPSQATLIAQVANFQ